VPLAGQTTPGVLFPAWTSKNFKKSADAHDPLHLAAQLFMIAGADAQTDTVLLDGPKCSHGAL
jgi:hypothetical protein